MFDFNMLKKSLVLCLALYLTACASTPTAPVIDRAPNAKKPSAPVATTKPATPADWRPSSYVVKKGDTLYKIGLEFGYDYKEIAAANNLTPPYAIKVGQSVILPSANGNGNSAPTAKPNTDSEDGVVTTPIKTENAPTATPTDAKPTSSVVTPILSQPKAMREIYSVEAYNRKPSKPADTAVLKPTDTAAKPSNQEVATTKPTEIKSTDDDAMSWVWPTNGKIIGNFNEAANKGIDIAGTAGQSIVASSSGKVIYSGSDLRGYGKLVIIKHNKTYLSVYAHNSKILVKEGQIVASGQKIAEMGNTDANTVKLHFEIRQQGKSVDPVKFLNKN